MVRININISEEDYNFIMLLIKEGLFHNKEDFIQEAIKRKLNNYNIINSKNISKKEAIEKIHSYCKEKGKFSILDIAQDLGFDIFFVLEVVDNLIKEGVVEKIII